MDINPFEPPRTADTGEGAPTGDLELSEEALREIAACAPWTRWLARIAGVSAAVAFAGAFVKPGAATGIGAVIGAIISVVFVVIYRQHTIAAQRIAAGDATAGIDAVDAQVSYFKTIGVLAIVVIVVVIAFVLLAVAAGSGLGPR